MFQMKSLLSTLDSHLGQKGKTFLSGDKVMAITIIILVFLIKIIIKMIIINLFKINEDDAKVGMPDLMLWPWFERFGCLGVKHPGMKVNGDDDDLMIIL